MDAGILTIQRPFNIGAFLQMYALYNMLLKLGYHPILINYVPRPHSEPLPCRVRYYGFYRGTRTIVGELSNKLLYSTYEKRARHLIDQLNATERITSIKKLYELVKELEAVVVGSDWVWSPEYPMYYQEYGYLLPFKLNRTLKIAYSASFGWDDPSKLPAHVLNIYREYVQDFDFISLREKSHVPFLLVLLDHKKPVHHTLDPTLLMDREWWNSKIPPNALDDDLREFLGDNFVFIYNIEVSMPLRLKPLIRKLIKAGYKVLLYKFPRPIPARNVLGSAVFVITTFFHRKAKFAEYINPFELLWIVRNATYVITDSFHGTIFSIMFERPFVSVQRPRASVRIVDLLGSFNLKDRFAYTSDDVERKLEEDIDYKAVKSVLEFHRRRSLDFLKVALTSKER